MLADFELAYRGFIQHRIRPCLQGMYPDTALVPLGDKPDAVPPEEIQANLEVTYLRTLKACEEALREIVDEPDGALFAIVEEFNDRVLRATAARDNWEDFYREVMAEVWAGPLGEVAARSGQFRAWNENVAELRACARSLAVGTAAPNGLASGSAGVPSGAAERA